ncbi:MAG: DUF4388 domain-containing protein [Gemmatimonadota bacterium]
MTIQGPLRELGIHDVFQLLDLSRKTGVLRVTSELRQNEGTIWFDSGAVIAAAIRSNPHRIGDVLLRAGKVREEDLVRANRMQMDGDVRRLGEILVAIGAVSSRELERQVRLQVEEVVFTMLAWAEGYFVFEEGLTGEVPRETNVRIATEALLMEGARRIDEWERIQGQVPHLGVVPRLAPPESAEPGSLSLTPFEWRVLAACEGTLDIRAIALSLVASEFDVARTLFGLASAGVILLHDPAVQAAAVEIVEPTTLASQGEEHLRRGDPAAARTIADRLIAGFPHSPIGPLLLGRSLLAESHYPEAEKAFREAVQLAPDGARALRLLGLARLAQGRFEEALQALAEWRSLPDRPAEEDRHLAALSRMTEMARGMADLLRGAL